VVPADDKPFARVAAAAILAHTLMDIDPRFPRVSKEAKAALAEAKVELEGQAPEGEAADPVEAEIAAAAKKARKGKKS
jgi:hypothetical protein